MPPARRSTTARCAAAHLHAPAAAWPGTRPEHRHWLPQLFAPLLKNPVGTSVLASHGIAMICFHVGLFARPRPLSLLPTPPPQGTRLAASDSAHIEHTVGAHRAHSRCRLIQSPFAEICPFIHSLIHSILKQTLVQCSELGSVQSRWGGIHPLTYSLI